MSLPDTAEYWWDVQNKFTTLKHIFTHLKGHDCGHFHIHEVTKLTKIDCYACLKHIENTPELKQRLDQSKQDIENHKFRFGKCICGQPMTERINKATNQKFLGCTNYPDCKHTKTIKN